MRLSEKVLRFIYSYYMLGKRIRDIAIDERATSQAIDQRRLQANRSVAGHIERRESWCDKRRRLDCQSIAHYDIAYLFFREGYPRRSIAKVVGMHTSTIIKIIASQNSTLGVDKKMFTL
jgi:transposase-like protein